MEAFTGTDAAQQQQQQQQQQQGDRASRPIMRHHSEPVSTSNASRVISSAFSFLNEDPDASVQRTIDADFGFLEQLEEADDEETLDRRTLGTSISTLDHDHVSAVLERMRNGHRESSVFSDDDDSEDSELGRRGISTRLQS